MAVTAQIQNDVSGLYEAFWNRAPDSGGFNYWVGQSAGTQTQLYSFAATFLALPEGQATYSGMTTTQQVSTVYQNVFGRAADAGGLSYWTSQVTTSNPFSNVVVQMLQYASWAGVNQGNTDGILLNNKIAVGVWVAQNVPGASSSVLHNAYSTVTTDTLSVAAAELNVANAAGTTFTLGLDNDQYIGNAGNNVFNAFTVPLGGTGAQTVTLGANDSLVGGSGTNTLNAQLVSGSNIKPIALTKIERISVSNTGTASLDLTNTTSATQTIIATGNTGVQSFDNVQSGTITYNLLNASAGVAITAGASVLAGTADTANFILNGANGSITVGTGYEGISITTQGTASTLTGLTGYTNTAAVSVSGTSNLSITAALANGQSLNASGLSGTLNVTSGATAATITGGSGNDTIASGGRDSLVGGNGNDTFVFATQALLTGEVAVLGGSGTDTILMKGDGLTVLDTDYAKGGVAGIEVLQFSGTGGDVANIGTGAFSVGISTVTGSTGIDSITLSALGALTVNGGGGVDTLTLNSTAGSTVTVNGLTTIAAAAITANDAITVGGGTAAQVALTVDGGAGTDSVTISNSGTGIVTVSVSNIEAVTGGTQADVVTLLGGSAAAVTLGNATAGNTVINVGTFGNTITGGTGADTFQFISTTSFANSTVNGGAGVDTVAFTADATNLSDGNFAKASLIDVVTLAGTGGNIVNVGTTALASGLSTLTGSTGIDSITLSALGALTVNGGGGVDTLTLASAAGTTVTVQNLVTVATIIDGGVTGNDAVTIGGTGGATVIVGTGAGLDTLAVTDTYTGGLTLSVSNVETVTGGNYDDTIVFLAGTSTSVINGGSGSNTVTLGAGLSVNVQNIQLASGVGSNTSTETVTFTAASSAVLTDVDSIIGSSGNDTLTDTISTASLTGAASASVYYINGGNGNDVLTNNITMAVDGTALVGTYTFYQYGGAGNDTITASKIQNGLLSTGTVYNVINGGAGGDAITLATHTNATGALSVGNIVQINLASDITSGNVTLTNADTITAFGTATSRGNVFTDTINLQGVTLANGATTVATQVNNGGGGVTYTGTTVVTAGSNLHNLATGANSGAVIFVDSDATGTTGLTASFTTQAGITAAVSYITQNIGDTGVATNANTLIGVNDGTNTAVFRFQNLAGDSSVIASTELTLVGVLVGTTTLTGSNFS